MKKPETKKIAKLNVHELEKRVAPASAAGLLHNNSHANVRAEIVSNNNSVNSCVNDPRCGGY